MWEEFKTYILFEKKLRPSKRNLVTIKSRYTIFNKYFLDKPLNRTNFNGFLSQLLEKGHSHGYLNTYIQLAKLIDSFKKTNELQDYTYFRNKQKDIIVLSPQQIDTLSQVHLPYSRFTQKRSTELNQRDYVAIQFLFATACRIGELQGLLWKDVRETPVYHVIFRDTKNGEDRTIPITKRIYQLLLSMPHYGERVFCTTRGKPFCSTDFGDRLKKRADLAGISIPVYAHIFRHSRADHLNMLGFSLRDIAQFLGHKDINATMVYTHPGLNQLVGLAYASPLESKEDSLTIIGKLIQSFLEKVLGSQRFFLSFHKTGANKLQFTIETVA